jgi:hypothetical protein
MKQTAVEWLVEQLTPSISLQQKHIDELKEKAKAMEKEQLGETWDAALGAFDARGFNRVRAIIDFDDYYNETYGK